MAKPEPSPEMDGLFLKALDGFMMVLSSDGDMVYLSENVSEYLGVSQVTYQMKFENHFSI